MKKREQLKDSIRVLDQVAAQQVPSFHAALQADVVSWRSFSRRQTMRHSCHNAVLLFRAM